jgi:hypothetical protein
MGKNDYLAKRNAINQAFLDAGEQLGMQKMWDYVQMKLRDPKIVDKDIFGRERLEKLFIGCKECADYFHPAFTDDVEADYKQEEMDAILREVWKEELSPFYERYPQLKKIQYDKGKKNWK